MKRYKISFTWEYLECCWRANCNGWLGIAYGETKKKALINTLNKIKLYKHVFDIKGE